MFPKVFERALVFLSDPTEHVTCGDMVFSAHTTVLMVCALVFKYYCRAPLLATRVFVRSVLFPEWMCFVIRNVVYIFVAVGAVAIVGTRLHYTLDVLLAVFLTHLVFMCYHDWAMSAPLKHRLFMIRWLEEAEINKLDAEVFSRATKFKK